jgi:hypothetical protein
MLAGLTSCGALRRPLARNHASAVELRRAVLRVRAGDTPRGRAAAQSDAGGCAPGCGCGGRGSAGARVRRRRDGGEGGRRRRLLIKRRGASRLAPHGKALSRGGAFSRTLAAVADSRCALAPTRTTTTRQRASQRRRTAPEPQATPQHRMQALPLPPSLPRPPACCLPPSPPSLRVRRSASAR